MLGRIGRHRRCVAAGLPVRIETARRLVLRHLISGRLGRVIPGRGSRHLRRACPHARGVVRGCSPLAPATWYLARGRLLGWYRVGGANLRCAPTVQPGRLHLCGPGTNGGERNQPLSLRSLRARLGFLPKIGRPTVGTHCRPLRAPLGAAVGMDRRGGTPRRARLAGGFPRPRGRWYRPHLVGCPGAGPLVRAGRNLSYRTRRLEPGGPTGSGGRRAQRRIDARSLGRRVRTGASSVFPSRPRRGIAGG